jgi:hypothetical protein
MSLIAGDLDKFTEKAFNEHCKTCLSCDTEMKKLEKEKKEFLSQYPVPEKLPSIIKMKKTKSVPMTLFALAASLIIVFTAGFSIFSGKNDGYRIKGTTQIGLFVQDEKGNPVKRDENNYYPGEKIQFTYSCGENRYFMLLSADSNHMVTVYYPSEGDTSIRLEPGRDVPLPNSIILDSYIGPELYLAVFSAFPLHTTHITNKLLSTLKQSENLSKLHFEIDNAIVQGIAIEKKEHVK